MAIYDMIKTPTSAVMEWTVPGAGINSQFSFTGVNNRFRNQAGNQYFAAGDSVVIQKMFIRIPYGFGQAEAPTDIQLNWDDGSGLDNISIPELSGGSGLFFPDLCHSLEMVDSDSIFLQQPSLVAGRRLCLTRFNLDISLINVPAALVAQVLTLEVMFLVKHTLVMQAAP